MMRLPRGICVEFADKTGFDRRYISNLITTNKRPGRERALTLEKAAAELGKDIPASMWLYGSRAELREAITG